MILNHEATMSKEIVMGMMLGREKALATVITYIPHASNSAAQHGSDFRIKSIYQIAELIDFAEFQLAELLSTNRRAVYAFSDSMLDLLKVMGHPAQPLTGASAEVHRFFMKLGWNTLKTRAQEHELLPQDEEAAS